jgi:hypothetical protein
VPSGRGSRTGRRGAQLVGGRPAARAAWNDALRILDDLDQADAREVRAKLDAH